MKLCILKSDQEDFIQLMEMYDIHYTLIDSIEYEMGITDSMVELIYIAEMNANQENQYFNWFELGQMFERHKLSGYKMMLDKMKKDLEQKLQLKQILEDIQKPNSDETI
jgi:hypothetical protein